MKYMIIALFAFAALQSFAHVKQLGSKAWQGSCSEKVRSYYNASSSELTWTILSFKDEKCSVVEKVRQNIFSCSTLGKESECLMVKALEGSDITNLQEITLESDDLIDQVHTIKITPQTKDKVLMNIRDTEETQHQDALTIL